MMFAAVVGHRSGRATPSLRDAPQRQSMETVDRETIYRSRNAVQTKPATSGGRRPPPPRRFCGAEAALASARFCSVAYQHHAVSH